MAIDPNKETPSDVASISSLQSMTEESAKAAMRAGVDGSFGGLKINLFDLLGGLLGGAIDLVGKILEGAVQAGSIVLGGVVEIGSAIINAAVDGVKTLFGAAASMIGNIFRSDGTPAEPLPDIYSPIAADLEEKLQPFLATVDEALEGSRTAGEAADKAVDDLAALINPDNEDSKLWQAQNAIDRLQNERDDYQDIAIEANRKATEALQQYVTRVMFMQDVTQVSKVENPHWLVTFENGKRKLKALPGWVGEWIYHSAVHRSGDFGPVIEGGEVTAASRDFLLDTATSSATLQYTIRPGVPRLANPPSVSGWVPARDIWMNIPVSDTANSFSAGSFTAVTAGVHEIFVRVGWDATTRQDSYGVRVLRQATPESTILPVKEIKQVGIGPLISGQNGYRTQSIQVALDLVVGERVDFQAWAGATGTDQRRMRDSEISVGWVDPPPNTSDVT
ncbi:MAG: hypothetical protein Q4F10_12305 [Corynebacterium glutamicum]|nr:hypothetical protein [Corynebacterium glutamicum]